MGAAPTSSFLDSLGARARRRAEPRLTIALAGAGCALAVIGVLVLAADAGSSGGDSFNQHPGVALSALVVAAGIITMQQVRQGPLATAGAVATVLGIPPLLAFATFDENSFPPVSIQPILVISTLAWLGSYLVGPGRGRPIFLGAALFGLWASALEIIEGSYSATFAFLPFGFFPFAFFGTLQDTSTSFESSGEFSEYDSGVNVVGDSGLGFPNQPNLTTIALLSIGFGVAYLVLSRRLDRTGHHGVALPFAVAGILPLLQGVVALGPELEVAGTALLTAAVGAGLAAHGSTTGRRATTWIGAVVTVVGIGVFIGDLTDDVSTVGPLFALVGLGLVVGAHLLAQAIDEPDEMVMTEGVRPLRRPPAITIVPPPTD